MAPNSSHPLHTMQMKHLFNPAAVAIALSLTLTMGMTLPTRAADLYKEPWRPRFHFTPERNWMNDPNGMFFYDGEYHLFYQYNPYGDKWGHMSWGHAVSKDLVHWEHLPVALIEENNIMIFSGSAVVDWKNTSGLGKDGNPPLIAIYTGHYTNKRLQNQQIAFSNDRGRTWTKYSGNPVLDIGDADFRDPKVFWHEPTERWIMAVAWPIPRKVRFYASPNLIDWTHLSDFGPGGSTVGIWECPDLFPLPVGEESSASSNKWVLIVNVGSGAPAGGSGCQYFVGDFDGKTFTLDPSYPKPTSEYVPANARLLADFEGADYAGWIPTGSAFGDRPVRGRIGGQQEVTGFHGSGLVNTFLDGDSSEGTLTSPPFNISHPHLSFLIGGGNHPDKTCLNLVVEGRVVRTATGDNDERLTWKSWDVREFRGTEARLEIVDRHTGGWGHINVDHILLADTPARRATRPALWADWGRDFYAAVSWSDVPKEDGRRIWIGWMSNWEYANDVPTSPWRSAMSIPRELLLRNTTQGIRMIQKPVGELAGIRTRHHQIETDSADTSDKLRESITVSGELVEVIAEWKGGSNNEPIGLRIVTGPDEATVIRFENGKVALDRTRSGRVDFHPSFSGIHQAPVALDEGRLRLHAFVDTSSIEVFVNDGETVLTDLILPTAGGRTIELLPVAGGGSARLQHLEVWELEAGSR